MSVRERVQQRRFRSAAEEAVVSLMVAAQQLEQADGAICARHGITGDQYNVLRILRGVHPRGHARGEIARRMIHPAPDITRMLDRLIRQGLVARARDPDDQRLSVATVTKAGLTLLERLDPDIDDMMESATASLSRAQLRKLARLCDALVPARDSRPPKA